MGNPATARRCSERGALTVVDIEHTLRAGRRWPDCDDIKIVDYEDQLYLVSRVVVTLASSSTPEADVALLGAGKAALGI